MTTASAPRGSGPPVAIEVAVPDSTGRSRRGAAGDHFVVQHDAHGRGFAGCGEIGGAHRKAVDIGAVERRHVDRRHDILRQHAAERVGKPPLLARDRARKQRGLEPRHRLFARQDGQELILIDAVAAFRREAHWSCRNPSQSRNI